MPRRPKKPRKPSRKPKKYLFKSKVQISRARLLKYKTKKLRKRIARIQEIPSGIKAKVDVALAAKEREDQRRNFEALKRGLIQDQARQAEYYFLHKQEESLLKTQKLLARRLARMPKEMRKTFAKMESREKELVLGLVERWKKIGELEEGLQEKISSLKTAGVAGAEPIRLLEDPVFSEVLKNIRIEIGQAVERFEKEVESFRKQHPHTLMAELAETLRTESKYRILYTRNRFNLLRYSERISALEKQLFG